MATSNVVPSSERWEQIEALFAEARLLSPAERAAFLDAACGDDEALRADLDRLLASHDASDHFLENLDQARAAALFEIQNEDEQFIIGPYRIVHEIGRGGMGAVYLAKRATGQFDQQVALKLIKRGMDSEAILRRFLNERQILARLHHPHIARLYDGGLADDGRPYFAMEYVDGTPITTYCDTHHLTVEARLHLFQDMCRAVQYAHQNLVVHRDLKPSNMLVTEDGQLKLLDFGIATLLDEDPEAELQTLTDARHRLLTPAYAAPEQILGEPITTATDVYALGIILYEMLTGRRPHAFENRTSDAIAHYLANTAPSRPSTAVTQTVERTDNDPTQPITPETISQRRGGLTPDRLRRRLSGDLDTVVLKALRREPERRYASAEAFLEDIRRHLEGLPVQAHGDTLRYRASKFVRRHKASMAAATLVVVSLMLGLAGMAWQAQEKAREAAKAQEVKDFVLNLFQVSNPLEEAKGDTITARALLERGVMRIDEELREQPDVQAEMLAVIGNIYKEMGRYDRAEPLLQRALSLRRTYLGENHLDVAESLYDLASLKRLTAKYDTAETLYREALDLRRKLLGGKNMDVAMSMNGLAMSLQHQGDYEAAAPLYRQALAIHRTLDAEKDQDYVALLNNLAVLLSVQGKHASAESLLVEALHLRREVLGEEHPHVALSMSNLAGELYEEGRYPEAESIYVDALAMQRRLLGAEHPDVAFTLNGMARNQRQMGHWEAAESLYVEALEMQRKLLGNRHPDVNSTLYNLAGLRAYKGNYAEAEPLYREVLATDEQTLGKDHPYIALDLDNLGSILTEKGDPEGALPLFAKALALHRRILGPDHPSVAVSLTKQAVALRRLGRYEEAFSLLHEAMNIHSRLETTHPQIIAVLNNLATTHLALQDYAASDSLYRQALEIQDASFPAKQADRAALLVGLGAVSLARKRPDEAEPVLREAMKLRESILPEDHWQQAEVQNMLGACLSALGRYEEAEPLLLNGLATLQSQRGEQYETQRARQYVIDHFERQGRHAQARRYRAATN